MGVLSSLPGPGQWSQLLVTFLGLASSTIPLALAASSADYYVKSLPGAPPGPLLKMHAGHIEITPEHNGNLFFWHYQNKHIANGQRTVIWLNGGPGCSSEDGAMMEIGPYRLKDDHTLEYNNGSWNEFANLLFVDNPVGTGFSYVDTNSYLHELDDMANDFVKFLTKFYELFPEYEHDEIYFAGESYAGQYIPYIAKKIMDRNKQLGSKVKWNVKGLMIGNGWIAPAEQYASYIPFALEKGLIEKDSEASAELDKLWKVCKAKLEKEVRIDIGSCENILQRILKLSLHGPPESECVNMYDVRLRDVYPSCGMNWPPDLTNVKPYLRRDDVVQALHVSADRRKGWSECSGAVGSAFTARNSKPSVELLPEILSEIPILLFSGGEDLICNHIGTESLISNLEWSGAKGLELSPGNWAPQHQWTVDGEDAGYWQGARNLTYVHFFNSSHMVPFDYPRRALDMLDRFTGVNLRSINSALGQSHIDGETGLPPSVDSSSPSTADSDDNNNTGTSPELSQEQQDKLNEVKWQAYKRSGGVVLVILIFAVTGWGYFLWRQRRKDRQGYQGLATNPSAASGGVPMTALRSTRTGAGASTAAGAGGAAGLEGFRNKRTGTSSLDLEAADFDEAETDGLHRVGATDVDRRYSIGGDSDEEADDEKSPANKGKGRS